MTLLKIAIQSKDPQNFLYLSCLDW